MSLNRNIDNLFKNNIRSYDDYVNWVRDWKRAHEEVVTRIMLLKSSKGKMLTEIRGMVNDRHYADIDPKINQMALSFNQSCHALLKPVATALYAIRATNKARLHDGQWPRPEKEVE